MGFFWYILTSNGVPNANKFIQELINATASASRTAKRSSCVSDLVDLVESFDSAAEAFYQLYSQFSLEGLRGCFGDVISVLKGIYPVLTDCNVVSL